MKAPVAKKQDYFHEEHGIKRYDPYHWMREREDPEVLNYLKEENEYTASQLGHLDSFREDLFQEMKSRIKETDMSVPYEFEGYFYYSRYVEGGEYPVYCRKKGSLEAEEQIMLNVNEMAKDHSYYNIRGLSISDDKTFLAYGEDTLGRRIYRLRIKNLNTGALSEDILENTTGTAVWDASGQFLFYTVKDESLRSYKVMRHKLGTDQSADVEVFHESDETFSCGVFRTKSRKLIFISSYASESSEYRFINANEPLDEFKLILERKHGHEYSVDHFKDEFYILTNHEAKNFRLVSCPIDSCEIKSWKELIPHRDDVLLEDMEMFEQFMVVEERYQGLIRMRVIDKKNKSEHYIKFDEEVYSAWTGTNYEYDTTKLRLGYTSLTNPTSVYEYDMESRNFELLKQQEVLGDFDSSDYEAKRFMVKVRDGVEVPLSLVYKKNMLKENAPLLLYGYGSYGHSLDPYFSSVRLSLLNRGFIFAMAHVRGGEEMGRGWYDSGKKLNKLNTFNDFIDLAEYLIREKWTSSQHLYAMGGSAGGLLMGAVMNMRPELWKGIVASVPFVDVLTTMLDESIPLTTGEYDEWGNPNDKVYFDYMLSYSPYDNIKEADYPNLLVTSGLHDSQVQYWEPTKWVARLREMKTDKSQVLLHTNMEAGHSGASGRFEALKELALEYAFLLNLEDIRA